jgi:hypothetical protein
MTKLHSQRKPTQLVSPVNELADIPSRRLKPRRELQQNGTELSGTPQRLNGQAKAL